MKKLYRTVLLTNAPLKTCFRFNNKFQVFPMDTRNKPHSPFARHFPCYLEYSIEYDNDEPEDVLSRIALTYNKVKEIRNLLSCLTNHRFFNYEINMQGWGIPFPNMLPEDMSKEAKDQLNSQESQWFMGLYTYNGLKEDLVINSFTDYSIEAIYKENQRHQYFMYNPIDDFQHEITFSNTISSSLNNYYQLSAPTLRKLNSCIYLACDGMDIAATKKSLAFLSYVSALEGLVDLEEEDNGIEFKCGSCKAIKKSPYKCPSCGRPIWGVKQKFVKFLSTFVADTEKSQKSYRDVYNLRSRITHTGRLFQGDYELSFETNKQEIDNNDYLMRLKTLQLFRIALDSWLLYEDKKKK